MKYLYIIIIIAFENMAFSQEIPLNFPVSTYIDKASLYPYSLTVGFEQSNVNLLFDEENNRFYDKSVNIIVNSDIPNEDSDLGMEYNLNLIDNTSQCVYQSDNTPYTSNIITLTIDGEKFDETNPVTELPLDSESEDGMMFSEKSMVLHSKEINEEMLKCNGSITIEAELSI